MKALKAYNTEAINGFTREGPHTEVVEISQDDPPEPPVPNNGPSDVPESDLDIPDDPILDFVNSQYHNSEDLDQAMQAYQAYQVPCPQDSTTIPERIGSSVYQRAMFGLGSLGYMVVVMVCEDSF